jgi:O-methyltransferase involved in polyketide biosynthesis
VPRKLAYLTKQQQNDLLEWIVGHSERYEHFIEWCNRNEIADDRRYTPGSLSVWLQRHRRLIQQKRQEHREAVRAGSTMDRRSRLASLEASLDRVEAQLVLARDTRDYVALETLKLKVLQDIARERGEYNQKLPPEDPAQKDMQAKIAAAFGGLASDQARLARAKDVTPSKD